MSTIYEKIQNDEVEPNKVKDRLKFIDNDFLPEQNDPNERNKHIEFLINTNMIYDNESILPTGYNILREGIGLPERNGLFDILRGDFNDKNVINTLKRLNEQAHINRLKNIAGADPMILGQAIEIGDQEIINRGNLLNQLRSIPRAHIFGAGNNAVNFRVGGGLNNIDRIGNDIGNILREGRLALRPVVE